MIDKTNRQYNVEIINIENCSTLKLYYDNFK